MYKSFVLIGLLLIALGFYYAETPMHLAVDNDIFYPLMVIFGGILFFVLALFPSPKPKDASKSAR
jgi:hypothetical protein